MEIQRKCHTTNLVIFIWRWWRGLVWLSRFVSPTVLSVALGSEGIVYVITFLTLPASLRHLLFWKATGKWVSKLQDESRNIYRSKRR